MPTSTDGKAFGESIVLERYAILSLAGFATFRRDSMTELKQADRFAVFVLDCAASADSKVVKEFFDCFRRKGEPSYCRSKVILDSVLGGPSQEYTTNLVQRSYRPLKP